MYSHELTTDKNLRLTERALERVIGCDWVFFDDFITGDTVKETLDLLESPETAREWEEHNYKLALKYYSYNRLNSLLEGILNRMEVNLE